MSAIRLLLLVFMVFLAGCASLHDKTSKAYDSYWECASQQVKPFVKQYNLSPRGAAVQAQARCKKAYSNFRSRQIAEVAQNLDNDSHDVAQRLGAHQALAWHKRVTRALQDYVHQTRHRARSRAR